MAKPQAKEKIRMQGTRRRFRVLTRLHVQNEILTNVILEEAEKNNWEMIDMRFFGKDRALDRDYHADGILCCRAPEVSFFASLAPAIVYVGYSDWFKPEDNAHLIEPDFREAGRLAAEHFLERGFKHVSCINIPIGKRHPPHPTVEVSAGLTQRLKKDGVCPVDSLLLPNLEYREGRDLFAAWLEKAPRPIALLVWQDRAAANLCGWCRDLGVPVPEEVAVLGIGNNRAVCKVSVCPLSSLDVDYAAQGRAATQLLQRMMQGEKIPPQVVLVPPVGIAKRKSTDVLAMSSANVARALRFLWEHLAEQISVDDAAAVAGISRSTLERLFRKQIGRSVNQELLRKRLDRCRELLVTTDLPITDIAPMSGFFTRAYLHRAFTKRFGISPSQYRQRHTP